MDLQQNYNNNRRTYSPKFCFAYMQLYTLENPSSNPNLTMESIYKTTNSLHAQRILETHRPRKYNERSAAGGSDTREGFDDQKRRRRSVRLGLLGDYCHEPDQETMPNGNIYMHSGSAISIMQPNYFLLISFLFRT